MMIEDMYTAGFIDGEGCIGVYTRKGYTYAKVEVAQTDKLILDWLREKYGGVVNKEKRKKVNPNSHEIWRWIIQGADCLSLLKRIQPYIRVKKIRLENAIKVLEGRRVPSRLADETVTKEEYVVIGGRRFKKPA